MATSRKKKFEYNQIKEIKPKTGLRATYNLSYNNKAYGIIMTPRKLKIALRCKADQGSSDQKEREEAGPHTTLSFFNHFEFNQLLYAI